jgi:uncharacterized protein
MLTRIVTVLMLAAVALGGCRPGMAATTVPADGRVALTITSANGPHKFRVEVAATPEQQERGLMFRPLLAPDAGMIFPMQPPRMASFWMKNCPVPIDMIFIRADDTIARIAEAQPNVLSPQSSGEPIAAVLEIAGGRAAALGIKPGDTVTWPN